MTPPPDNAPVRKDLDVEDECFVELFQEIPEAIVLSDSMGRVFRVNREFCRMFGYTAAEAVGHVVDELVAPEDVREEAMTITEAVAHGQKFTLEVVRKRKDGSRVNVSLLGVPIITRRKQVAVFGVYRDITERIRAERALIESRRQLEEANSLLERISNLDGLTAIPNRRSFENFYELEWRRCSRERKWISVIMIDVDFFKSFNDNHGHLAGDQCLKQIAQALQVLNRPGDLVARYGGEEFVAVLSGSDRQGALQMAERMRQRVRDLRVEHGFSKVAPHVTISAGIASQQPDGQADPMDLILKADQALYQAKSQGRDRAVGFEG